MTTISDIPIRVVTDCLCGFLSIEDGLRSCFAFGSAFLSDFIATKKEEIHQRVRPIEAGDTLVMLSQYDTQVGKTPTVHMVTLVTVVKSSARTATVRKIAFSRGSDQVGEMWLKKEPETRVLVCPLPYYNPRPASFVDGYVQNLRITGLNTLTVNKSYSCRRDRDQIVTFYQFKPDAEGFMRIPMQSYPNKNEIQLFA